MKSKYSPEALASMIEQFKESIRAFARLVCKETGQLPPSCFLMVENVAEGEVALVEVPIPMQDGFSPRHHSQCVRQVCGRGL
jgi:hypothetical protein